MSKLLETLRFFFMSFEAAIVAIGVFAEMKYSTQVLSLVTSVKVPDEQLKYLIMFPAGLCGWAFVSGRKLLFPENDKSSVLFDWPDYWRLKAGFSAALAWSVVFMFISIIVWFADWKQPTSGALIALVVSMLGSAVCALSIYNAQTNVEEAVGRFRNER
ncbi:MAG: hypothetical protein AB1332_04125 [Pseudomonadota bacterium]|jgi:hypothetical protein